MSIAPQPQQEERTWAALCHAAAFATFVLPSFGSIIGPLVVWLIKKDVSPFVNDQGKEALNFQISCFIYFLIAGILCFILIGIPLLIALAVFWLIEVIVASVNASNGVAHRYPLTIRFVS